jgi:hypothetical protein
MSDDPEKVEWQKDFEALDCLSRARVEFAERLCEASATDDEEMLDRLRDDKMFELASFLFCAQGDESRWPRRRRDPRRATQRKNRRAH